MQIQIQVMNQDYSIGKLNKLIPMENVQGEFFSLTMTEEEISLVCQTEHMPSEVLTVEHGWRAFKICGVLDFSLIGILSRISTLLAEAGVSIFAVSTYNTDYILVKNTALPKAMQVFRDNGYIAAQS